MKPGAGVLLVCTDGTIFLLRRSRFITYPHHWNLPGGAREPGETYTHAAIREFVEEAGSLPNTRHVATYGDPRGYVTIVVSISEREARTWKPVLNWESDDWGWFPLDRLPRKLHPALAEFLRTQMS